jgi:imidazolonepropionase-like amidohydrolase
MNRINHDSPRHEASRRALIGLSLLSAALGPALLAHGPPVAKPAVLVTGARILDVAKGRYLAPAAVLVQDGRIASITPEPPASIPASATRLSADGAVIVPGLIDAHAWAAPTPDLDADYFYLMGLAHGVTGYRVLDVRTVWGVAQRVRAASGAILAPLLWTSGGGINQGASPDRWRIDAPDAAAAAREVSRQIDAKVNWIAGHDALGPEMYKAMVLAAKRSGVRISGAPGASSMADLAAAEVSSIETLTYPLKAASGPADEAWLVAGAKELAALQAALVRGRVTLVPMMAASMAGAFPEEVAKDPTLALLPEGRRAELVAALKKAPAADVATAKRAWTGQAAFLTRFVKAGGRVAAGTGFDLRGYPVPGAGLLRELIALVRAGLTPADALRAATVTAAELVGAPPGMIRLEPGTEANFIVVKGDPLARIDDLANITHVVRGGEVLDPKALLARAKQAASLRPR